MTRLEREWETYSSARKAEEVALLRERYTIMLVSGMQWLTLMVMVFLTLGAMELPTPSQAAIRQFAIVLLLAVGALVIFASLRWGWEYEKIVKRL